MSLTKQNPLSPKDAASNYLYNSPVFHLEKNERISTEICYILYNCCYALS